jgi:hypothetical protein
MMRSPFPAERPAEGRATRWRAHGIISTVLLIMLAVMIVRDILVRRWSSQAPPPPDVTQRQL